MPTRLAADTLFAWMRLEELPVLAAAAGIGPPATLVVGAVASIPAQAAVLAAPLGQDRHSRSSRL